MTENPDSIRDRQCRRRLAISREVRAWVIPLVTAAASVVGAALGVMLR
ncbi:hypothetical protein O4328_39420 [Rhodococcus opacus]|uniref:Uncharacterized protein n=1 Tax=Rhodococcus opacus TaxID=37919 RepID=A0AAX3YSS0_RHOOP|nr:hypothetical protein [Rhodococcus opacus]MCZ4589642.1 hypothetical protein [Rhodococcus opacus]WLF51199.1 hypothetical protein Q5707_38200 [Rhodococcus opacus]